MPDRSESIQRCHDAMREAAVALDLLRIEDEPLLQIAKVKTAHALLTDVYADAYRTLEAADSLEFGYVYAALHNAVKYRHSRPDLIAELRQPETLLARILLRWHAHLAKPQ